MEYLDLHLHSLDDMPGKLIHLNGADYVFGKLYNEGGHGYIYPLMNIKSELFLFVAKLDRFRSRSEAFEQKKSHLLSIYKTFSLINVTDTIESGTKKLEGFTRSEVYECCGGGLFQIMPFYASPHDEKYFKGSFKIKVNEAVNLQRAGKIDE